VITEAEFLAQVLELARLCGWLCAHFRPARTNRGWRTAVQGDGAGWPDLLLAKGERLVVAELKVARRKLTAAQQQWLTAFRRAGVPAYVWRPEAWDEIQAVLTAR
jgi:VRR-NUC domain